ncbi:hypothetical protein AcV7_005605 [Taiwanofungus camphoratus]|nr:hypothetical protein AcV7_005605 [Antrodia cinnamomea]
MDSGVIRTQIYLPGYLILIHIRVPHGSVSGGRTERRQGKLALHITRALTSKARHRAVKGVFDLYSSVRPGVVPRPPPQITSFVGSWSSKLYLYYGEVQKVFLARFSRASTRRDRSLIHCAPSAVSFTGSLSKGNQEDPVYDKTVSYRHKGTLLFELNHISHQIKSICQTSQLRTTELVWFEARAHLCEISLGISYAHTVLSVMTLDSQFAGT